MEQDQEGNKAASEVLDEVVTNGNTDKITFSDLKTSLHERGFGLLLLIFSLPLVAVPPGLTMIACLPSVFLSAQMVCGMDSPWFPKWLGKKSIKRSTLAAIIKKLTPFLHKIERILQPRFYIASSKKGEQVIGIFALIFSISIAVPLPFTNFVPSIAIAVMALGLLSKDGLIIIVGMILGMIGCTITFTVLFFGTKIFKSAFGVIASLFGV
ncbi:MAG: exopolysaccharide biosynthesis protein [Rickettsiales bacterium]|nr:exopolysaccharide biosynthesis protein [Rickettsiales bacterium]